MPRFVQYGFPCPDDFIMTFIGGSQLHAAKLQGLGAMSWVHSDRSQIASSQEICQWSRTLNFV
jgi:hypothetical protein